MRGVIHGFLRGTAILLVVAVLSMAVVWAVNRPERSQGDVPYKIYVTLGFHTSFYHSWRGDTPDEAGFGTDIRIVREILKMLDAANAKGLDARGYWEADNFFTLGDILPKHAPDIIDGIRRRHEAGLDEILLAPANNGLFHAMTQDEMRMAIRWAISNPWGSGAKDLFGSFTPLIRPQEYTYTTGANAILKSEGLDGVLLGYSNYPFTSFSNFIPALPTEQRYNPLWLKTKEDDPPIVLMQTVSLGDIINFGSLEKWMLELRELQTSGQVNQDVLLHINFDADAETWLPVELPSWLSWIPNTGGLEEYIAAVNKYEWAEFTNPGEYLKTHPPNAEILVRQDMADGGWDGNFSWAEKQPAHDLWTGIERARSFAAVANPVPLPAAGSTVRDYAAEFWRSRLVPTSTTHFGMSTPTVNEERQAVAEKYVDQMVRSSLEQLNLPPGATSADLLYEIQPRRSEVGAMSWLRIPVVIDVPVGELAVSRGTQPIPFDAVGAHKLPDGRTATTLWLRDDGSSDSIFVRRGATTRFESEQPTDTLTLEPSCCTGWSSLRLGKAELAGAEFLKPMVSYRHGDKVQSHFAGAGQFLTDPLESEDSPRLDRTALSTTIEIPDVTGEPVRIRIETTRPRDATWFIADVDVQYPHTPKRDLIHTVQQKLRRYIDLNWIEVAPFQIHPDLTGTTDAPLRVWKKNFLGVVSHYDLDYGRINAKNANVDSFNHQVTESWIAVSDRDKGLLLAQHADTLSSFAFAPMRLREENGKQQIWINPFGSYHGKQMDYFHLDGNGLGSEIAERMGAQFRPNGPSYNGTHERFSLLIAPYDGDAPPAQLQKEAEAFAHPPVLFYAQTPDPAIPRFPHEIRELIDAVHADHALKSITELPPPSAFLVNPTEAAIDVVWDSPPNIPGLAYEVSWRTPGASEWNVITTASGAIRHRISELPNGKAYEVRVRSVLPTGSSHAPSMSTATESCTVGPVAKPKMVGEIGALGWWNLLRIAWGAVVHALTT